MKINNYIYSLFRIIAGGAAIFYLFFFDSKQAIAAPVISLSDTVHNFGAHKPSSDSTFVFTLYIRNTGTNPLNVSNITRNYIPQYFFNQSTFTIAAGDSAALNIAFHTTVTGVFTDTIRIYSNDATHNPANVYVTAVGSQVQMVLFQNSIDYGAVYVDSIKAATLQITNWGNDTLRISAIQHRLSVYSISDSIFIVPPNIVIPVTVNFRPAAEQTYLDTLTIFSNDGFSPQFKAPLRGTGGKPHISVTDSSIEFGQVIVDSTGQRRLPVKNTGQYPLFISNISGITGHDTSVFLLSNTTGTAPGNDSAGVFVTFRPDSARSFRDTLTVRFLVSPDSVRHIFLHGTGVAPNVTIAPFNPVNFGFIRSGSSKTINLGINNTGTGLLSIGNFSNTFGSIGRGSFSFNTAGTTISPTFGYSLPLTIIPPDSQGLYSFDFSFHTNDPDSLIPHTKIYFQVVPPLITLPDSVCRFDTLATGSARLCTVRIVNNDTASQTVSLTNLSFSTNLFSSGLSLPRTIQARETLRVSVRYSPVSGRTDTGFAYFNFSSPSTFRDTVRLYGTGRGAEISPVVTSYQFPDKAIGDSAIFYLGVQNTGTDTLRITGVSHSVSVFYVNDTVKTIAPGRRDSLRMRFRPTDNRGYEDTLHIFSNAIQSPNLAFYVVGNTGKNFKPVITSVPPDTILEDSLMQYRVQVYDRDGDSHSFSLLSGPADRGLHLDSTGGILSWRPLQADVGSYSISIRVTDAAAASDTQRFTLTVKDVNEPPTFLSNPDTLAFADSTYHFYIKAFDEDGDSVRFFLIAGPAAPSGMTLNVITRDSAAIYWTPRRSQTGINPVVIELHDGRGGITNKVFNIRVNSSNFAPVFAVLPDTTATEKILFMRQLRATDRNNDSLKYHVLQAPPGLSVDSVSGLVRWTPDEPYLGNQLVRFYVSDGFGGYDTTQFNINAINVNEPPVVQQVPDTTIYDNGPFHYDLRATNEDSAQGTVLRYYSSSGLFAIDSITGIISATPHRADTGSYSVKFRVSAGALSDTITWNVKVAHMHVPPVIVTIPNDTVREGVQWSRQVLASGAESGLNLTYQDDTPLFVINPSSGLMSFTPTSGNIGTHTIHISVSDGASTTTTSFQLTVLHVNHFPSIQALHDTTVYEDQHVTMRAFAADPDSNTQLRFSDNTPLFAIDSVTGIITFTPAKKDTGRQRATVFVSDGALSDSTSFWVTVIPVNHRPVISPAGNQVAWVDSSFSLRITANDLESGTNLNYSDTSPLFVINPQTGLIQFTPVRAQVGIYPVSIIVSDGILSDTLSFTLRVREKDNPPVILQLADTTGIEDVPFRRVVSATDPDSGDVLKFYDNSPLFAIDSLQGIVQFTPVRKDTGRRRVTVWVTDGYAADSTTFSLFIQSVNHPPAITSLPETLAYEGQQYRYQVRATDPDNDVLLYELTQGPSVMQLDMQTGLLTWTPLINQAGVYQIEIRVSDRKGGRATQRYFLQVRHVNFPPVIVNFPALQFFENDSLVLDLTPYAYDPDDPDTSLSWSVTNLKTITARVTGRTVHFKDPLYWNGRDTASVIVRDPQGAADTLKTVIRVIGINQPPRVAQDTVKISFNQDDSATVDLKPWAADPDSDRLYWQLAPSLVLHIQIDSAHNVLKLTTSPHFAGIVALRAIVYDSVGFSDTCYVKITVSAKNLPPVIISAHPAKDTIFIDQLGSVDFGVITVDPEGETVSKFWLIDGVPRSNDSLLHYAPPPGFVGIQEVKLVLFDGKNTTERIWRIAVSQVSAISLENFTVSGGNERGICLRWNVRMGERATFNVYRSRSKTDDFKLVTSHPVEVSDPIKGLYQWYDRDVNSGELYYYLLEFTDGTGVQTLFGPLAGMAAPPSEWALEQNYPNPFNSSTIISFRVPYTARIRIALYDLLGRQVRVIVDEKRNPGYYSVNWDGKNAYGIPVASGVYIVRFTGGTFQKSKKMMVVR